MRLKEKLQGIVPEEYLCKLSNRFHVIGDIAVLSLPSELEAYKKEIAWGVLSQGKYIRTVLNKTTRLEGERRVANFEHLAGDGMVTMHKEFGFVYHLDVTRVFFNSHLGHERMRVASHVKAGERVLVPFAGVGPFAVPLAARGARVVALEKNREACLWLAENARLNGVGEEIFIINADAFYVAQMIRPDFDRVCHPHALWNGPIFRNCIAHGERGRHASLLHIQEAPPDRWSQRRDMKIWALWSCIVVVVAMSPPGFAGGPSIW